MLNITLKIHFINILINIIHNNITFYFMINRSLALFKHFSATVYDKIDFVNSLISAWDKFYSSDIFFIKGRYKYLSFVFHQIKFNRFHKTLYTFFKITFIYNICLGSTFKKEKPRDQCFWNTLYI